MNLKNKIHSPLPEDLEGEVRKSADILAHFVKGKTKLDTAMIPKGILDNAKGIAVITILKAGFVWTGRAGSGLVVARLPDGRWSAPSAAGAGFGAQIGAQLTDCVFVLNTLDAVKAFSHGGNITLGGNMSVAAGPVGRSSEALGTIANLAPIYSYSKSKGLFAGISLEGSVIITRGDANAKFYGRKISAKEILNGSVEPPACADAFYRALDLRFSAPASTSNENTHTMDTRVSTSSMDSTTRAYRHSVPSNAGNGSSNGNGYDVKPIFSRPPPPLNTTSIEHISSPARPTPPSSKSISSFHGDGLPSYQQFNSNDRASGSGSGGKSRAPPPPIARKPSVQQRYAKATFSYTAQRKGDLSFSEGDVIEVIKGEVNSGDEWWTGRFRGEEGSFPCNYVVML